MALCSRFLRLPLLLLGAMAAPAQQSAPIVQPGAPGQPSKLLTEETVWIPPKAPFKADIEFMQGMIMHHLKRSTWLRFCASAAKAPS